MVSGYDVIRIRGALTIAPAARPALSAEQGEQRRERRFEHAAALTVPLAHRSAMQHSLRSRNRPCGVQREQARQRLFIVEVARLAVAIEHAVVELVYPVITYDKGHYQK